MNHYMAQGRAILIGTVIGACVTYALTKTTATSGQIDVFTAGVYFGCRNASEGAAVSDRKRCLALTDDARRIAGSAAYKKAHPVLW